MIDLIGAIFGFFIMLGLMFVGLHVGIAMLATGVLGAMIYLVHQFCSPMEQVFGQL